MPNFVTNSGTNLMVFKMAAASHLGFLKNFWLRGS